MVFNAQMDVAQAVVSEKFRLGLRQCGSFELNLEHALCFLRRLWLPSNEMVIAEWQMLYESLPFLGGGDRP